MGLKSASASGARREGRAARAAGVLLAAIMLEGGIAVADQESLKVLHSAVAIRDVCAWPNLTLLPSSDVVATIFNQPSHGGLPGDVDCWASSDGGRTWEKRGMAAARPGPDFNRMNVAAGLAADGDLVVVASGYRDPGRFRDFFPALVCRSSDGARTWQATSELPEAPTGQVYIPYGDIVAGGDGALRMACYAAGGETRRTYLLRSGDDGRTWGEPVVIGEGINETALLHLGGGAWIAAARTHGDGRLLLWRSDDDGATWRDAGPLSEAGQHPAHLQRLADGRVLLTYGDRRPGEQGVRVLFGSEDGEEWGGALRIVDLSATGGDLGYPSSVQLADGTILTAYYASTSAGYAGYQMGVVVWELLGG